MMINGHPWTGKYDRTDVWILHILAEVRTESYLLLLSLRMMVSSENEKRWSNDVCVRAIRLMALLEVYGIQECKLRDSK
jgi:hypothetical protein